MHTSPDSAGCMKFVTTASRVPSKLFPLEFQSQRGDFESSSRFGDLEFLL